MAHTGSVATRLLVDRTGTTADLSAAMYQRNFVPVHDRDRVLTGVVVMLADGGEAISDIDVLRHQAGVLSRSPRRRRCGGPWPRSRPPGCAGSPPRGHGRRHVWAQLPQGVPASRVASADLAGAMVLDADATVVIAHSEKKNAAATFNATLGLDLVGVWCENTSEFLAAGGVRWPV